MGQVLEGVRADQSPNTELPGCVAMERSSKTSQPSGSVSTLPSDLVDPKEQNEYDLSTFPGGTLGDSDDFSSLLSSIL